MKRCLIALALLGLLIGSKPVRADNELHRYVFNGAAIWEKQGEKQVDGVTVTDLHLISQTWQGMIWEHRLMLFRPPNSTFPNFCTLLNTGGRGGDDDMKMGAMIAKSSGMPFAILFGIPKQPLYGGKTEDELVVYTWQKYLETGDSTWPLHFPMAKAVVKAMDALQEYSLYAKIPEIKEFLITGASKRGWTTWLVGATKDKRVKGIAPMVIDTLNVGVQIPHQIESYGKASEEIADYSKSGMLDALNTEKGRKLLALEDPYSYRDILTLPKLIINGTNDQYWAQDALNFYWDGLKGKKWIAYIPNSGHGLEDRVRTFNSLTAFGQMLARRTKWPEMKWQYTESDSGVELLLNSDIKPKAARLFRVYSSTKDFRNSKWTYEPMTTTSQGIIGQLKHPSKGYAAMYGEAVYEIGGKTFTLTTQIRIVSYK
ncbi:MAG: PhoPQ-activated protein PqaA family protein [Armatimonadetes bacterium]|nr:PhoPQ-activated protein PqaA family protein [Armatimonadota bacterium]